MRGLLLGGTAGCAIAVALLAAPDAPRVLTLRNVGLAQLEEGKNREARATFARLADLVPDDPLPYADGAVAALRENDLPGAEKLLDRAVAAGGERADLHAIRAALESARNQAEASRAALKKAASLDAKDLESRWRFVRSLESDPAASAPDRELKRRLLSEIVAASPANLPARLKLLLAELEAGDPAGSQKQLGELERVLADADARTKQLAGEAKALLAAGDTKGASLKLRVVENLLRVTSRYQQSLGELFTNVVGVPVAAFSAKLEKALRPKAGAAIPVTFSAAKVAAEDPALALRRVDLKNDGRPELYTVPAPYTHAVFFDYDLDGDLDVYLYGGGRPDKLLRNNLDGTFTDVTAATGDGAFTSRKVIVGDFDRDGDLDLLVIDGQGALVLRVNQRQGVFKTVAVGVSGAVDVAAEDVDNDGILDLVVATSKGLRLLLGKGDGSFSESAIETPEPGASRAILLADLDNDGLADVVLATETGLKALRNEGAGKFTPWNVFASPSTAAADALLARDVDNDGDLDLVVSSGGKTSVLLNQGGNANAWLDVTVEGLATGSGKVNRAGVGSLVEVKAGDLYVARTVGLLPAHFGLGSHGKADVVRVTFTNGIPQNIFDARARAAIKEVQQLKGSCPFVYALDGSSGAWHFVSDALGNAPLGLLYDGVHLAGAVTREWLAIDGEILKPTPEGKLVLDYTEELWEAVYLDEATLMAVDHPEGTRIVPNERMVPFPLPKTLFTVANPRPLRRAISDVGGSSVDVTDRLGSRDRVYVNPGPETNYQGVRAEHSLTLDLGPVASGDRVMLYLTGWIFYADTSINVSISQRSDIRPLAPLLEVPDGKGGWKTAIESFGYPAGKTKTMPVDLTGIVDPADPRIRIRTTLAIFWDEAFVTVNDPEVPIRTTSLAPDRATLFERGFSRRYRETPDGQELFDHDDVTRGPKWEDLPGRVTRLGDVTPLLTKADDRWVAFKGGDAIRIEYDAKALPALEPGFRRDYVLVSDGWEKDFDKNTITGQGYEPWPFHAMSGYPYRGDERHPDPRFVDEWLTRRVGPEEFRRAVKDFERR